MAVPAPDEFVRRVQEKLGVESPTDLARAIGLTDFSAPQRVRRWITGRNGPDYIGTMLMLQACGWLSMADRTLATAELPARGLDEEVIAQALEELVALQERQDAVLERLLGHASEQAQPQSEQKSQSG